MACFCEGRRMTYDLKNHDALKSEWIFKLGYLFFSKKIYFTRKIENLGLLSTSKNISMIYSYSLACKTFLSGESVTS